MDNDDYNEGTGYFDEDGNVNFSRENGSTAGKYHSDWCSMMYSRLLLARNLLTDDGVIFISIDDNEQDSLKKICNELFGTDNFIGQFIWQRRTSPDMRKIVSTAHDYILAYSKNNELITSAINKVRLSEKDIEKYKNIDDDPHGPWTSSDFTAQGFRPNQMYEIVTPGGKRYTPPEGKCWKTVESEYLKQCEEGRMWFGKDGLGIPRRKTYLKEREGKNVWTWWPNTEVGHSQEATQEVKKLFEGKTFFDYPKPVRLLKKIEQIGSQKDSIVLDFFSGSATSAHAVMQLNAEDSGHRKFIMVQIPEPCGEKSDAYKAGYATICDIGKERIRRAGEKIKEEHPDVATDLDVGFRVLKLDDSNMKDVYYHADALNQANLFGMVSNIKEDRNDLDLLFGCVLDWGLPLSLPYHSETIDGCTVHIYNDGDLVACFDEHVPESVVTEIAKRTPLRAVFRDASFANSADKINVFEIFKRYMPESANEITKRVKVI